MGHVSKLIVYVYLYSPCSDTVQPLDSVLTLVCAGFKFILSVKSDFGVHRVCQIVKWLAFVNQMRHDALATLHESNEYTAFWHYFWVVSWLISFPKWLKAKCY